MDLQQDQEEFRQEVKEALAKILENNEATNSNSSARGALGTPNSGMITSNPNLQVKNKGVEGSTSGGAGGLMFGENGWGFVLGTLDQERFEAKEAGRGRFEFRHHRKVDMPTFDGSDPDGWVIQAERYFAVYQLTDEEKIEAAVLSLSGDALVWFRWSYRKHIIATWEELKALFLNRFRSIDLYEQWSSLEQTGSGTTFPPKSFTSHPKPSDTNQRSNRRNRTLTEAQFHEKRARGLCYKCEAKWNPNHKCKTPG